MGADVSKPLSSWSTSEVARAVASISPGYSSYASAIEHNDVNGALLSSLIAADLDPIFQSLEISNALHQLRLTQGFEQLTTHTQSVEDEKPSKPKRRGSFEVQTGAVEADQIAAVATSLTNEGQAVRGFSQPLQTGSFVSLVRVSACLCLRVCARACMCIYVFVRACA